MGAVVVTLIEFGVVKPQDVLTSGQVRSTTISGGAAGAAVGGTIGAAATPITATTTTAQPAPTVVEPRKYPNQTCEMPELRRLEKEKDDICNLAGGYAAICPKDPLKKEAYAEIPCSLIKLSLLQRQACLAARWKVQNECFGGKPDAKHKEEIDQVQNGVNNCEAFKLINCAKSHPMANK